MFVGLPFVDVARLMELELKRCLWIWRGCDSSHKEIDFSEDLETQHPLSHTLTSGTMSQEADHSEHAADLEDEVFDPLDDPEERRVLYAALDSFRCVQ